MTMAVNAIHDVADGPTDRHRCRNDNKRIQRLAPDEAVGVKGPLQGKRRQVFIHWFPRTGNRLCRHSRGRDSSCVFSFKSIFWAYVVRAVAEKRSGVVGHGFFQCHYCVLLWRSSEPDHLVVRWRQAVFSFGFLRSLAFLTRRQRASYRNTNVISFVFTKPRLRNQKWTRKNTYPSSNNWQKPGAKWPEGRSKRLWPWSCSTECWIEATHQPWRRNESDSTWTIFSAQWGLPLGNYKHNYKFQTTSSTLTNTSVLRGLKLTLAGSYRTHPPTWRRHAQHSRGWRESDTASKTRTCPSPRKNFHPDNPRPKCTNK